MPGTDLLDSVQQLKDAWNIATATDTSVIGSEIKTQLEKDVADLENFYKTKCKQLPYPTNDTAVVEFWGFGSIYFSRGRLKGWQAKYNWLDMDWLINVLVFKTKWLVVKKSVMEKINLRYKGGPAIFDPQFLMQCFDTRFLDLANSHRKVNWDINDFFTGTYDAENEDVKAIKSGDLVVPSRGMCSIGKDYRATPLIPKDLYESGMFVIYTFGSFPPGMFSQFKD